MSTMMSMAMEDVIPARLDHSAIRSGLVIEARWLDPILLGEKTWEMRSTRTHKREWIGLIRKGSKTVVGIGRLAGAHGRLSLDQMKATHEKHRIPPDEIRAVYERHWTWAWELGEVHKLEKPITYTHPKGAQHWVTFDEHVRERLRGAVVQRVAVSSTP